MAGTQSLQCGNSSMPSAVPFMNSSNSEKVTVCLTSVWLAPYSSHRLEWWLHPLAHLQTRISLFSHRFPCTSRCTLRSAALKLQCTSSKPSKIQLILPALFMSCFHPFGLYNNIKINIPHTWRCKGKSHKHPTRPTPSHCLLAQKGGGEHTESSATWSTTAGVPPRRGHQHEPSVPAILAAVGPALPKDGCHHPPAPHCAHQPSICAPASQQPPLQNKCLALLLKDFRDSSDPKVPTPSQN